MAENFAMCSPKEEAETVVGVSQIWYARRMLHGQANDDRRVSRRQDRYGLSVCAREGVLNEIERTSERWSRGGEGKTELTLRPRLLLALST